MLTALTFAAALVIGLVVTPIVRTLAHRLELLDMPGGRKVHQIPVPRLGGVAMVIAFGVAIGLATLASPDLGAAGVLRPNRAPAILAGVSLLLVIGIVDDVRGMRALIDRKSTRLNSSHLVISYAVFCLKKKRNNKCINLKQV